MTTADSKRDLSITRTIKAPRAIVWKAWTTPAHLEQWWCPTPWRAEVQKFDLRPGGAFDTVLHGPNGEAVPGQGAFLEIVPQQRIVFTSALREAYRPSGADFLFTAIITLADEGAHTRYAAHLLHADAASRDKHAAMGFEEGWGTAIAQLEALAQKLV